MSSASIEMQTALVRMMITDPHLYPRVSNILDAKNFHKNLQPVVTMIKDHAEKYNVMPDSVQILATTGQTIDPIEGLRESDSIWFLDEFERFTKRQELERAILKAADLLEKGNYDPVEKLIKDAVQISLQKDLGTEYFANPRARLEAIKNSNGQISTGWPSVDNKLYGGFNRGELQIFAGGSGSGKSLFMQNLSVNWAQANLNGVYITLELSEELCSWRIDSMMSGVSMKNTFKDLDDVDLKVRMIGKRSGAFWVKYLPAQSTVNDIRAYIKNLQIESGKKIDFLCIDYLDLLMPVSAKVSPSDLFIKDKYVSEEIRNLAKELKVLLVTASQLNRNAVEEVEFDHSHISGGISKINTADNVFGIYTSRAMRERGQYQIQFLKTRNSSGVGQKIDLSFDRETLRIFDNGDDHDNNSAAETSGSSILDKIRTKSTVTTPSIEIRSTERSEQTPKIAANIQSNALKSMIASIKKQ